MGFRKKLMRRVNKARKKAGLGKIRWGGKPARHRKKKENGAVGATPRGLTLQLSKTFPDVYRCKSSYSREITVTMGAGVWPNNTGVWWFRFNSAYDPDFTSTGGSVMGFAEMSNIYLKYRVYGASITVIPRHSRQTYPDFHRRFAVVAHPTNEKLASVTTVPTALTNFVAIAEQPYGKVQFLDSVYTPKKVKHFMTVRKLNGLSKSELHDTTYSGLTGDYGVGSNPARPVWFGVYAEAVDGTASSSMDFHVKLTLYMEYFERKTLASSYTTTVGATGATGSADAQYQVPI